MDDKDKVEYAKCSECGTPMMVTGSRPAKGWKRIGDTWVCTKCQEAGYCVKTVSIPVSKPLDMSWEDFGDFVRAKGRVLVDAFNYALNYLQRNDYVMTPALRAQWTVVSAETGRPYVKLPKHPKVSKSYCAELYAGIRDNYPELCGYLHSYVERQSRSKWDAQREDVIVRNNASCARIRNHPIPCGNDWDIELGVSDAGGSSRSSSDLYSS